MDYAKLMSAFAQLLWPASVILLIFFLRPAMVSLIESAKTRKFSLKIGGQELEMEEASEQQRKLIYDLQAQLVELRERIERPTLAVRELTTLKLKRSDSILWVDDKPKNNSYFVEQLSNVNVSVDLALSTSEAMKKLKRGDYRCVITDMGRMEDNIFNYNAGIDLLKLVKEKYKNIPVIIFCSIRGFRESETIARNLGATMITYSPVDLFSILELDRAKLSGLR